MQNELEAETAELLRLLKRRIASIIQDHQKTKERSTSLSANCDLSLSPQKESLLPAKQLDYSIPKESAPAVTLEDASIAEKSECQLVSLAPKRFQKTGYAIYEEEIKTCEDRVLLRYIKKGSLKRLVTHTNKLAHTAPYFDASAGCKSFSDHLESYINNVVAKFSIEPDIFVAKFQKVLWHSGRVYAQEAGCGELLPIYEYSRAYEQVAIGESRRVVDSNKIGEPDLPLFSNGLLLTSAGGAFNYGHWLVDDLPKVSLLLSRATELRKSCLIPEKLFIIVDEGNIILNRAIYDSTEWVINRLLARNIATENQLNHKKDRQRSQLVTSKLKKLNIILLGRDRPHWFSGCQLITPISLHPCLHNESALKSLNLLAKESTAEVGKIKIFVNRKPGSGRCIENIEEVEDFLKAHDYVTVYCEELSFDDQLRLFSMASDVVGIMGASMCNLILANPGISPIFLVPEGWLEPFYHSLLNSIKMKSTYMICEVDAQDHLSPHRRNFKVDLCLLKKYIH